MRILLVTDAWRPQINGVVRTLETVRRELVAMGHTLRVVSPIGFATVPCPTYPLRTLFEGKLPFYKKKKLVQTPPVWNDHREQWTIVGKNGQAV